MRGDRVTREAAGQGNAGVVNAAITGIGLNPVRILRVAMALEPNAVLAITTPETEHLIPELRAALTHLGSAARLVPVAGDGYRFDVNLHALRVALSGLGDGPPPPSLHWVIGGGTKPMIAAQAVAAAECRGSTVWSLDDRAARLTADSGDVVQLSEPPTNLTPELFARMHAGLAVAADPDQVRARETGDAARSVGWLLQRLREKSHILRGESSQKAGKDAEEAVVALVRSVISAGHSVHGSLTVDLRDPSVPTLPATEERRGRRTPRRFEVDGMVIRGTRAWVLETKFANLALQEARVAAAELNTRRRHLAGDAATGVLLMLADDVGDRFPSGVPDFDLGRVRVVTRRALIDAAEAVLSQDQVANTELAQVFAQ